MTLSTSISSIFPVQNDRRQDFRLPYSSADKLRVPANHFFPSNQLVFQESGSNNLKSLASFKTINGMASQNSNLASGTVSSGNKTKQIEDFVFNPAIDATTENQALFDRLQAQTIRVPFDGLNTLHVRYLPPTNNQPTFLMLMGTSNIWKGAETSIQTLHKKGYGIAAMELQGVGLSEGSLNLQQAINNVLTVSRALNEGQHGFYPTPLNQQCYLGYSLGSAIMTIAATHNQNLRSLHLLAPIKSWTHTMPFIQRADPNYQTSMEIVQNTPKFLPQQEDLLDITPYVSQLKVPTQVLIAEQDTLADPKAAIALFNNLSQFIPGSSVQILPTTDHSTIWNPWTGERLIAFQDTLSR